MQKQKQGKMIHLTKVMLFKTIVSEQKQNIHISVHKCVRKYLTGSSTEPYCFRPHNAAFFQTERKYLNSSVAH